MIASSPFDLVFRDVFFELTDFIPGVQVFLKLEGFHITGSIKIKTALSLLRDAETKGLARRGITTIIESSSGNLGAALSCACSQLGYKFICITDPNALDLNVRAIRAYGGLVHIVTDIDDNGGYVGSRIAAIEEIIASDPNSLWLNQYSNEANVQAHANETAPEIFGAFPELDWLFVGVGTSGTLMGCAEYMGHASLKTKLVAVDPVGSVIFDGPPGSRHIPGIGNSRRPALLDPRISDHVVFVDELDTIAMCRHIGRKYGILIGGSSGTVAAAMMQIRDRLRYGETIVAIAPDLGDKYLSTVYEDDWVVATLGKGALEAIASRSERFASLSGRNCSALNIL